MALLSQMNSDDTRGHETQKRGLTQTLIELERLRNHPLSGASYPENGCRAVPWLRDDVCGPENPPSPPWESPRDPCLFLLDRSTHHSLFSHSQRSEPPGSTRFSLGWWATAECCSPALQAPDWFFQMTLPLLFQYYFMQ